MAPKKPTKKGAAGTVAKTNQSGKGKTATTSKPPAKPAAKPSGVAKPAPRTRGNARAGAPPTRRSAWRKVVVDESSDGDDPDDPPGQPPAGTGAQPGQEDGEAKAPIVYGATLAEVAKRVDCTYDDEAAELSTILQVQTDPNTADRLAYKASFFLTTDLEGPNQDEFVGFLDSWRIDKATAAKPQAKASWIKEFLMPKMEKVDGEERWFETSLCLRALYTKEGVPKANLKAFKDELRDRGVIFVALIYFLPDHQDKGLLRPALTSYRKLLRKLPEWFAFEDMLVLVPGAPEGEAGDAWINNTPKDAEDTLTQIYRNRGGYVVCSKNAKVGGQKLTVMGRVVPPGDGDDDV